MLQTQLRKTETAMRRFCQTMVLALAILLLGACSGVQIGYRHADIYLAWKVNEYFDLDGQQFNLVRPAIDSALRWHRTVELPEYANLLGTVQVKLRSKVTVADVRWLDDEIGRRVRASVSRMALEGAPILATITPVQIEELEQRLAKDNNDFYEKFVRGSMEKQQTRRVKRFVEGAEHWTKFVTDEQQQKIEHIVAEAPQRYALALEERKRVQREFVAILREGNSASALVPRLNAWIANWQGGRSAEYSRLYEISMDQRARMAVAITDSLTSPQRAHALAKLQAYIEDMRALAVEAAKKD